MRVIFDYLISRNLDNRHFMHFKKLIKGNLIKKTIRNNYALKTKQTNRLTKA